MGREGRNNAVEIARQEKNRWKKRALRAEATLGKVREYVPRLPTNRAQADLRAILDESPTDVATALPGACDVEKIATDFATSPTEWETPADEPIAKRLTHTYMGDCPDDVNGWESRDPECPACRALMGGGYR